MAGMVHDWQLAALVSWSVHGLMRVEALKGPSF